MTPSETREYYRCSFTMGLEQAYAEKPQQYAGLVAALQERDVSQLKDYSIDVRIMIPRDFNFDWITDEDYPVIEESGTELVIQELQYSSKTDQEIRATVPALTDDQFENLAHAARNRIGSKTWDIIEPGARQVLNDWNPTSGPVMLVGPTLLSDLIANAPVRLHHTDRTRAYPTARAVLPVPTLEYYREISSIEELAANQEFANRLRLKHHGKKVRCIDVPGLNQVRRFFHSRYILEGSRGYFGLNELMNIGVGLPAYVYNEMEELLDPLSERIVGAKDMAEAINIIEVWFCFHAKDAARRLFNCAFYFDRCSKPTLQAIIDAKKFRESYGSECVLQHLGKQYRNKIKRESEDVKFLYEQTPLFHNNCHKVSMKAASVQPVLSFMEDSALMNPHVFLIAAEKSGAREWLRSHDYQVTDLPLPGCGSYEGATLGPDDVLVVEAKRSATGTMYSGFEIIEEFFQFPEKRPGTVAFRVDLRAMAGSDSYCYNNVKEKLRKTKMTKFRFFKTGKMDTLVMWVVGSTLPGKWEHRPFSEFPLFAIEVFRFARYVEKTIHRAYRYAFRPDISKSVARVRAGRFGENSIRIAGALTTRPEFTPVFATKNYCYISDSLSEETYGDHTTYGEYHEERL